MMLGFSSSVTWRRLRLADSVLAGQQASERPCFSAHSALLPVEVAVHRSLFADKSNSFLGPKSRQGVISCSLLRHLNVKKTDFAMLITDSMLEKARAHELFGDRLFILLLDITHGAHTTKNCYMDCYLRGSTRSDCLQVPTSPQQIPATAGS